MGQAALCALSSSQNQHLGVGTGCIVCSVPEFPTCFRECWDRLFFVWNSLPLTVLGQKSERKPKRPKKSQRGQGVLEQRFYTAAKAQSTRDCGSINISKSQERRLYTANSSSLQETVGAEASPREVSVKKEGSTQQPKLSLQETVEASTSPRVKKEDSTQRTAPVCKRLLEQKHLQER